MPRLSAVRTIACASLLAAGFAHGQGDFVPAGAGPQGSPVAQGAVGPVNPGVPAGPALDPRLPAAQLPPRGPNAFGPAPPQELQQPFPQQTAAEIKHIDDVLSFWETQSGKIDRYRTDFKRWVTDPVFGPPDAAKTYSQGEIRFEAPDKGIFRVDQTLQWQPAQVEGEPAKYADLGETGKEQWICDGKSLFEFNYPVTKLVQRKLPPEMQGKAIADGPLPFVFGAKKQTILSRYWIKVTTPPQAKENNEIWLEAYPKRQEDAVNYSKIEIIIDRADFLPSAIKIYERNNVETIYKFENRTSNWAFDAAKLLFWQDAFEPATPSGWELLVEEAPGQAAAPRQAFGPAAPAAR